MSILQVIVVDESEDAGTEVVQRPPGRLQCGEKRVLRERMGEEERREAEDEARCTH